MKLYFLFGEDAVETLNNEGIEVLKQEYEEHDTVFDLYVWDELESTPFELLEAFTGWGDYSSITEEQFNFLNS